MNKVKIAAALIFLLSAASGTGLICSAAKAEWLQKKPKNGQPGARELTPQEQKLKEEQAGLLNENTNLLRENEALKNENKALKEDRDNLINRAKSLLADVNRLKELEDTAGMAIQEKESLEKEKAESGIAFTALKEELNKLQEAQKEIIQERDYAKSAYEKAKKDNTIKELKSEIAGLKKEKDEKIAILQKDKNTIESSLKQAQRETAQLREQSSKLGQDAERLDGQLKEYKTNYAQAAKTNKALESEIKNMPKKFTEIGRQNKRLIRETSEMHYNLGVFYTKNKEYERAIAEFEKVIEITPDDAYAHFNLGYIYAEYLVNRKKATENFRHYLRLAKSSDKDIDWAKKYLLTWETYEGKVPMR